MYSTFHHLYDFEDLPGYSYQPVLVDTIVQIQSINDVNLNGEYMDATIAISMKWKDSRLQQDSSEFGNVTKIRVRKEEVWIPDLTIVNRIHDFSPQDEKHPKCEFQLLFLKIMLYLIVQVDNEGYVTYTRLFRMRANFNFGFKMK